MVLDGGVIDDIGRHAELIERNDIYGPDVVHAEPACGRPAARGGPPHAAQAGLSRTELMGQALAPSTSAHTLRVIRQWQSEVDAITEAPPPGKACSPA